VGIQQKTEIEHKNNIYNIYSQLLEESSSDRRQVLLPQLLEKIIKWSIDYYYKEETKKYWFEIRNAVFRIAKPEDNEKIPEDDFFKYLKVSLYHAKVEYIGNYEEDNIHIPKGQRQKLKQITEFIRMEESELGKELSEYEKVKKTANWFNITEDKAREYLDKIIYMKSTGSLTVKTHGDDKEKNTDILDSPNKHPNNQNNLDNPAEIFFSKFNALEDRKKFKEILESVFASRQEKTRRFFKALFTAQCLDTDTSDGVEWLYDNFEWMREYLDPEILETFKEHETKPTNREIYLKYYPGSNNPDQSVSARLKEFRDLLKAAQEEKGLRFFSL